MASSEAFPGFRSDLVRTVRDLRQTLRQINETLDNARSRFDLTRAINGYPVSAACAAVAIGYVLGIKGRSSVELLAPAARTLVVSAAITAFWAIFQD